MHFKEPSHLKLIAPIVLEVLKLPQEPKETIGTYREMLVDTMCRELEKLVKVHKSKRARDAAIAAGFNTDLSDVRWRDRHLIRVNGLKAFHFEHTETVSELKRSLNELSTLTIEAVETVLSRARVTWVTVDENSKLDEFAKSKRPDWREAYSKAEIEIIESE